MKKMIVFFACTALCFALYAAAAFKKGDTLYVSVRETVLKSNAGFTAKDTGKVVYGDVITVLETGSKKSKVQLKSDTKTNGWIANGSLTKKKIVKKSDGSTVRASTDELALAGKGFSDDAEAAFKSANKDVDYAAVDALEKITVSESDFETFVSEGHLSKGSAK